MDRQHLGTLVGEEERHRHVVERCMKARKLPAPTPRPISGRVTRRKVIQLLGRGSRRRQAGAGSSCVSAASVVRSTNGQHTPDGRARGNGNARPQSQLIDEYQRGEAEASAGNSSGDMNSMFERLRQRAAGTGDRQDAAVPSTAASTVVQNATTRLVPPRLPASGRRSSSGDVPAKRQSVRREFERLGCGQRCSGSRSGPGADEKTPPDRGQTQKDKAQRHRFPSRWRKPGVGGQEFRASGFGIGWRPIRAEGFSRNTTIRNREP